MSTIRRPARRNSSLRSAWVATMVPFPGSDRPSASVRQFIELAVNMPEHEPQVGQAERSTSATSSSDTLASPALIDAMIKAGDASVSDEDVAEVERSACPTCGSCSGMFTANSMNCLTEALGLSLPGNGTIVATHADRKELFLRAGRLIVDIAKRHYEGEDYSLLPRSIATRTAFENAMTLDVAMGGSTNTVLHLLAAAHEAEVEFTMADIDRISRQVPCLCKVAPMTNKYHIEDVHRAGGIMAILGELSRAGLLDTSVPTVHSMSLCAAIEQYDIKRRDDPAVQ